MSCQGARWISDHGLDDPGLAEPVVAKARLVRREILIDILVRTRADVNNIVKARTDTDICAYSVLKVDELTC